jgi:hypothetical protein
MKLVTTIIVFLFLGISSINAQKVFKTSYKSDADKKQKQMEWIHSRTRNIEIYTREVCGGGCGSN